MAGIHADRGDKSHRIVSGQRPELGLHVFTNNLDKGVIETVATNGECGYYCDAWHTVRLYESYDGKPMNSTTIMNCDRLTTRKPY
jgi:hypothetical protein